MCSPIRNGPDPTPPVRVTFGGREWTKPQFEEFLTETGHREIARILEQKSDHPLRKLENLNRSYELEFELGVIEPMILTSVQQSEHRLLHMTLRCKVDFRWQDIPVRRHLFGGIGVTVATYPETRIVKVQMPGEEPRQLDVPVKSDEE